ncbi:hypothetical protein PFTANZ_05902, partial [Plasmodium falciparum Tanzania (2000708)]
MAPKDRRINENELSARDVLEKIGLEIYNKEIEKRIPHKDQLIGTLWQAQFLDGLHKAADGDIKHGPEDSCGINHLFHTNITNQHERNPCFGRYVQRFDENAEAYCNSDKIRGNENNSKGGACAPPRRQHICDHNLEYLNNNNTDDTDDLLGNVLVTAKYEGDIIVSNHPDKNSSGNKSSICTALARSFADIGDIVRGRDMFKPNTVDKVHEGLKVVFQKIYDDLKKKGINDYNDISGNYYKLREAWWTANRDQVWKAITCDAPRDADYFRNISGTTMAFTSEGQCRRNDNSVPTNLDYVPQFLRWFDEWAEEFCRKKKIRIDKLKKQCRGVYPSGDTKYCSGDGHICDKTDKSHNNTFIDLHCPGCLEECIKYKKWIGKRQEEFDKQKRKYMNEIKIKTNISNNEYDKKFYENLDKKGYSTINTFLELLNNGNQCEGNNNIKNEMNFKNPNKAFGPSEYCDPCPIYGVKCIKEICTPVNENEWINKNRTPADTSAKNMNPTIIDIMVNDGIGNPIDNELEKNCEKYGILKGIKKQQWQCQYLNNIDQCKINNVMNSGYFDNKIAFNVLFQRWLRYFVKDYNKMREKLNPCIKNENINENICIKRCKKNCECVGKWLEKKDVEWEKIKEHYKKNKSHYGYSIPYWIKGFYEQVTFPSDFFKALEDVGTINGLEKLKKCQDNTCKIKEISTIDVDFIKEIISWFQNKIKVCKDQHDEDNHEYCCDTLPKSVDDDEEDDEEVDEEKEESSQTTKRNISQKGGTKSASCVKGACALVKRVLDQKRNGSVDNCNPKTFNNKDWDCDDKNIDNSHKVVCMPPRRKSICIHNLTLEEQTKNKYQLREAFIKCAAKETNLLWDKYIKENSTEMHELEKGKIPEDFMRIMFYTFGDFRDFCLGTAIFENGTSIEAVKRNMDRVLGEIEDISQDNNRTERQKFWDQYKNDIWKGMLCSLTYKLKSEDQQKITDSNIYKVPPEDFAKKPTFLRWLEEWYDDFSNMRQKMMTNMQNKCNENTKGKKDTYNCSECSNICQEYRDYMKKKKHQWDNQKGYYYKEKEILNGKGNSNTYYEQASAQTYLEKSFAGDIKHAADNELDNLFKEPYKEITQYCGCDKFNSSSDSKESIYKVPIDGRGESNCEGLYNARQNANSGSVIKWENTDEGYRFLKNSGLSSSVYIPPRRQKICFKGLDDHKSLQTTNDLRKKLMEVTATEGMNLGEYYKNQNEATKDAEKYAYNVEPCSALKYSFLDFGNIIKGNDNLEPEKHKTEKNLRNIFTNLDSSNGKNDINKKRNHFWNENKECFWKAMKCGYQMGRYNGSKNETIKHSFKDLKDCDDIPPDTDNTTDSKDGQFLRWFKEWSENFCARREHEVKKLENACKNYNCNENDDNEIKKKCQEACKDYRTFVTDWKYEYQQQKKEYDKVKSTLGENDHAHEYLKKSCNSKCSCIDELSKQSLSLDIPSTFDHPPKEIPDKCPCPDPPYKPSKINYTTKTSYEPNLPSFATVDTDGVQRNSIKNDLEDESSDKNKTLIFLMNCIEKSAYESMEYIEKGIKNIKDKLRGNNLNLIDNCDKVDNVISCENGYKIIDEKKLNDEYKVNNACPKDANTRFEIGKLWLCDKINKKDHHICLPPRRQHMCIKKIESMFRNDVQKSDDLLKIVIEEARKEGIQILKSLNFTSKDEYYKICDAMKYSFADIGDIIRGYDLWNKDPTQERIQTRLGNIFRNIYGTLDKEVQKKYMDPPYYYKLREDWWSANRKDIWKAMTCAAPEKAYFTKKAPDGSGLQDIIRQFKKCSRDKDPPVDDYIPQRLRWMQEWSEYFCEVLNKEMLEMHYKCETCIQETSCVDDNGGNKCTNCKEQCKKYKELVNKWKLQFDKQSTKYEELYLKTSDDIFTKEWSTMRDFKDNNKHAGIFINRRRNSKKPIVTYNERNVVQFLKKVKQQKNCSVKTANAYLHKTSNCKNFDFNNINTISHKKYAFEIPPEGYDKACKCIGPEPLDRCPDNDTTSRYCKGFVIFPVCTTKTYNDDLHVWNNANVKFKTGINYGVLVPPRRRRICLTNMITKNYDKKKNGIENFKTDLLQVAYNEGYFLCQKYDKHPRDVLSAMKYTFADIADIVKGKDMINDVISTKLGKLLDIKVKSRDLTKWWKKNKKHVWHAMLCGYKNGGGIFKNADCNIPNEEHNYQFLRWFQEWTEKFCDSRQKLYEKLNNDCKSVECNTSNGTIGNNCTIACQEYSNYISRKKDEYLSLKSHYDMNYRTSKKGITEAHEYLKEECRNNCECFLNHIDDKKKTWKNTYETLEETLKGKCECKKIEPKISPDISTEPEYPPSDPKPATPLPPQNDEPINSNILSSTIPLGIALALSSIAFLFLKKKSKSPVDLFRVIDIPKGDYGIPTLESKNRYIPYRSGTYKGKTYIYMEGDSGDEDKYAFMSDTTDITSSESEYEELEVNDIYVPGSPKYKTLIEVVLEPSKSNGDTLGDDMVTTTNTFTDEEWNQLKQDFISQYIQSEPLDVPNDYKSGTVLLNTQPNTLYFDKPEEKPFIMSIHDRNLYSGEEISYNIHM